MINHHISSKLIKYFQIFQKISKWCATFFGSEKISTYLIFFDSITYSSTGENIDSFLTFHCWLRMDISRSVLGFINHLKVHQ